MSQVVIEKSTLNDIADAINETNGQDKQYKAAEMAPEIDKIRMNTNILINEKADKCIHYPTITIPANGWSAAAPFTQTVQVNGMVADGVAFHDLASHADKTANKEFTKITNLETQAGKIVATCLEKKPTVDLDIVIKVVF